MTSNSHYQYLSNALSGISGRVEDFTRQLNNLIARVKTLEGKIPEPVIPKPSKPVMRTYYFEGPCTDTLELTGVKMIFVTMVGGGGAGSISGGGAGEAVHRRVMSIPENGKIIITAGLGGYPGHRNGENSSVEVVPTTGDVRNILIAEGGKGAEDIAFGTGAISDLNTSFDGRDGSQGIYGLKGGAGGGSYFASGGRGGYSYYIKDTLGKTVLNPKGEDGSSGSGGGGTTIEQTEMTGKGGNGFVIIEYPEYC